VGLAQKNARGRGEGSHKTKTFHDGREILFFSSVRLPWRRRSHGPPTLLIGCFLALPGLIASLFASRAAAGVRELLTQAKSYDSYVAMFHPMAIWRARPISGWVVRTQIHPVLSGMVLVKN
jgi:hypothetical protein